MISLVFDIQRQRLRQARLPLALLVWIDLLDLDVGTPRRSLHRLFRLGGGLAERDFLDDGELPMKWPLLRVKGYPPRMG
jgi:hypothetical protein